MKFHPDRNKSADATKIMAQINTAYTLMKQYIEKRDRPRAIFPQQIIINFGYGPDNTTVGNGFSWNR